MNAGDKGRWSALVGLCLAAGLVWLAFADLSVALPTISTERSIDLTDLQWSNIAFSLTCGALVLAAGRFGDQYGRRRMLLVGIVVLGFVLPADGVPVRPPAWSPAGH